MTNSIKEFNAMNTEVVNGMVIRKKDVIFHIVENSFERFEDMAAFLDKKDKEAVNELVAAYLKGNDFKDVLYEVSNDLRIINEANDRPA